jgi:hypothetical protein
MDSLTLKAFLEAPLPKKSLPRKDRFAYEESFEVKPLPIRYKTKSLTDVLALARTVSDEELRPAMCGIFHDVVNKCLVTTNGHYLIVLPDESLISDESKVLRPDGSVIDEKFPEYREVLISHDNHLVIDNPIDLLSDLAGVNHAMKFIDGRIVARIEYDGYSIELNPEFMFLALRTLVDTGAESIRIELPDFGNKKAVIFRDASKPERFALVMPIMDSDGPYTTILKGSTIPEDRDEALTYLNKKLHKAMADITWSMRWHTKELREAIAEGCSFGIRYHRGKLFEECLVQETKLHSIRKIIKSLKLNLAAHECTV